MNSALRERVHGFLNSRSVSHSVECDRNSAVTPASSSSQFSMGVTSTATEGPKLDPPSLRLQLPAPPSSITAAGSFSTDCAKAVAEDKIRADSKTNLVMQMTPRSQFRAGMGVMSVKQVLHLVHQRRRSGPVVHVHQLGQLVHQLTL